MANWDRRPGVTGKDQGLMTTEAQVLSGTDDWGITEKELSTDDKQKTWDC